MLAELLEDRLFCPKCNVNFHYQLPRKKWMKLFFPGSNVRRFFCGKCMRKYDVRVDPLLLKKWS